jgi:hypothetical protein
LELAASAPWWVQSVAAKPTEWVSRMNVMLTLLACRKKPSPVVGVLCSARDKGTCHIVKEPVHGCVNAINDVSSCPLYFIYTDFHQNRFRSKRGGTMKRLLNQVLSFAAVAVLLLSATGLMAQDLVFSGTDFESWNPPEGLVDVQPDGIEVRRFNKTPYNAVANADEFESIIIGDLYGSVRPARTPSNQADAHLIADQDPNTWWKPDAEDPTEKFWVELDLGRAVIASKIRVIFPDTTGARPFTFFSVFTSPGVRINFGGGTRIALDRVGLPVNNNKSRVVEFDLEVKGEPNQKFSPVRFVRFEAVGRTADAALAEIEVDVVGFNLSSKVTIERRTERGDPGWGGRTWTSFSRECTDRACGRGSGAEALLDEDLGFRKWNIEAVIESGDWRDSGFWAVVDFGNTFRVDRAVWIPGNGPYNYSVYKPAGAQKTLQAHCDFSVQEMFTSDGSPSRTSIADVEGPFDYDLLVADTGTKDIYDFQFPSRPVRLFNWRVPQGRGNCRAMQLWIFHSDGYPAAVSLQSNDIPLGGARNIRRIEWEADLPPGTRIEVQTQTGNGFQNITRYFLTNGKEVTKDAYELAKKRQKGDIVEESIRDASWSDWSNPHVFSGQSFQSPTPRQWLQARVVLSSDDPEVFPKLHSLRFVANDPVISAGVSGSVFPREAALDSLMEFRYTIKPVSFRTADVGFDQVLIALPAGDTGAELVSATVGGVESDASGSMRGDSLLVQLTQAAVKRDSVEITFRTRVFQSPTVFETLVSSSVQEDNAQGVLPEFFGADQVFVPQAVAGGALVRNISHSEVFTPNQDGINDLYELRFIVVKTGAKPQVRVFSLDGIQVAELEDASPQSSQAKFTWDGGVGTGQTVPPGIYVVQIAMRTDAEGEAVQKLVHVVY